MPKFNSPLDSVHIAAPCSADWNEMNGDERVRHCASCQLNVYNLSAMTKREAERLLIEREGNLCVRFYRRMDGTIITQNCPKGLAAIKRRVSRAATSVFSAAITFLSGVGVFSAVSSAQQESPTQGSIAISADKSAEQNNNPEIRSPYFEAMGGLRTDSQYEILPPVTPLKKHRSYKRVKQMNRGDSIPAQRF